MTDELTIEHCISVSTSGRVRGAYVLIDLLQGVSDGPYVLVNRSRQECNARTPSLSMGRYTCI